MARVLRVKRKPEKPALRVWKERISHLQTLYEVGHRINSTFNLEEILQMLTQSMIKDLGFEKSCVVYLDKKGHKPQLSALSGFSPVEFRLVLEQVESLLFPTMSHETVCVQTSRKSSGAWSSFLNQISVQSLLVLPLRIKSQLTGFILAAQKAPMPMDEEDRRFLAMYAAQASTAVDNARLYEELGQSNLTLEEKVQERTRDLIEANERLRSLDQVKSNFIAMISHELRTPLTSIKGFAVTLFKYDKEISEEKRRVYLEVLNEETDRLTRLITELLDISRIESGHVEMLWQMVDVPAMVQKIFDRMRSKAGAVKLEAQFVGEFPRIMADVSKLEQVFVNLLENAIKYSPATGQVRVTGHLSASGIQIEVSDQGPGIPFSEQEKVFDKFYREDNEINRRHPGTGLGLPICRALVNLHGGKIWLDDESGQGCRIQFRMPLNTDKAMIRKEAA